VRREGWLFGDGNRVVRGVLPSELPAVVVFALIAIRVGGFGPSAAPRTRSP
jgi:hypothetical protein